MYLLQSVHPIIILHLTTYKPNNPQEEMERIRAGRDAPLSPAQREEDERVLSFIEKYLRRMNIEMSKVCM